MCDWRENVFWWQWISFPHLEGELKCLCTVVQPLTPHVLAIGKGKDAWKCGSSGEVSCTVTASFRKKIRWYVLRLIFKIALFVFQYCLGLFQKMFISDEAYFYLSSYANKHIMCKQLNSLSIMIGLYITLKWLHEVPFLLIALISLKTKMGSPSISHPTAISIWWYNFSKPTSMIVNIFVTVKFGADWRARFTDLKTIRFLLGII